MSSAPAEVTLSHLPHVPTHDGACHCVLVAAPGVPQPQGEDLGMHSVLPHKGVGGRDGVPPASRGRAIDVDAEDLS